MTASTPTTTPASPNPFKPALWNPVPGFEHLTDITYHRHIGTHRRDGIVRIAFNRPEVRNAFRPHTVDELYTVLDHARQTPDVGSILLTGNGPSPTNASAAAPATVTPTGTPPTPLTKPAPKPKAADSTFLKSNDSSAPCRKSSSPS